MAFLLLTGALPIYELDFAKREDGARAAQLLLHGALDMVDLAVWASKESFLRVVDRHNDQLISAYATPGGARLLLLHDARCEEGSVRSFFLDVHELFTKLLLNPFYAPGSRIESTDFDARVRQIARKHLRQ